MNNIREKALADTAFLQNLFYPKQWINRDELLEAMQSALKIVSHNSPHDCSNAIYIMKSAIEDYERANK